MTSEAHDQDREGAEAVPANEELQEPSVEKEPGQEPKGGDAAPAEPSHEAVGIGVIGAPLVDPEQAREAE